MAGVLAPSDLVVLRDDARYIYDGLTSEGLPLVIISAVCGIGVLVLLRAACAPRRPPTRGRRRRRRDLGLGRRAVPVPAAREADDRADAAAPSATLTGLLVVFGIAVALVLPAIGLLYTLAQRNLIEETSRPTLQPPQDDGGATSMSG